MSTCLAYDTGGKDTDGKPVYEEIGVNHAYAWEAGKSVEQMAKLNPADGFEKMVTSNDVKAGDIVQMVYNATQHTMIIYKIMTAGIWVADSNWGYGSDVYDVRAKGVGDFIKVNGRYIAMKDATEDQKNNATESYVQVDDDTVRLRFVSYDDLNPPPENPKLTSVKDATIYRKTS